MEALCSHGLLPLNALRTCQKQQSFQLFSSSHIVKSAVPFTLKSNVSIKYRSGGIRIQAVQEEYELKQMKDMAAAKQRWDALVFFSYHCSFFFFWVLMVTHVNFLSRGSIGNSLSTTQGRMRSAYIQPSPTPLVELHRIREGKVKALTPREAGYAIQLSNKMLLDVRPSMERKKAWVKGSTWVPIFDADDSVDLGTLSRKATNFLLGGWWSGVPALSVNKQFLSNVQQKFPRDTDLIVACQKGLRSIAACEILYNAGYSNIFWVQGGLEAAEEEDLEREGPQPFKFAGIGGLSEFLGWTDQQRDAAAKEGLGYRLMFSARLVGLFLVADALFIGAQRVGQYLQEIRSH